MRLGVYILEFSSAYGSSCVYELWVLWWPVSPYFRKLFGLDKDLKTGNCFMYPEEIKSRN